MSAIASLIGVYNFSTSLANTTSASRYYAYQETILLLLSVLLSQVAWSVGMCSTRSSCKSASSLYLYSHPWMPVFSKSSASLISRLKRIVSGVWYGTYLTALEEEMAQATRAAANKLNLILGTCDLNLIIIIWQIGPSFEARIMSFGGYLSRDQNY